MPPKLFPHMAGMRARRVPFRRPFPRTHYSTKPPLSTPNITRVSKYIAGVVGSIGLWYFVDDIFKSPPHLDSPLTENLVVSRGPSKDQVTRLISQEAYSFKVEAGHVTGYDGTRIASNSPSEDCYVHGSFPSPWRQNGDNWMAWGVFDGHAGWQTADLLQKQLLPFVRHQLSHIDTGPDQDIHNNLEVETAMKHAFVKLDDSIFKTAVEASKSNWPLQDKLANMAPAFAGSCALLSLYDPEEKKLHVACTGDSRAVFGQQNNKGLWEAIPMSIDQTGYNQEEIARIKNRNPGEGEIFSGGRVLGIMISRAFGDSRWKWPVELQKKRI